jgi:hypothetical protein
MTRTSKSITSRKAATPTPTPPIIQKPVESIQRPSLGQSMKEGFGLGVGVSVAQHAVSGVMNFFSSPKTPNPIENTKVAEYEKCMKYSSNDSDLCKSLLNN